MAYPCCAQNMPQSGQYTAIAASDNTARGQLPGGISAQDDTHLSASQLAARQQLAASANSNNALNGQRLIAADVTKVVGANVKDTTTSLAAAAPTAGMTQVCNLAMSATAW